MRVQEQTSAQMVSLASMPESTKHSRSRNCLSQGFVTTLSTILAKGAVSLGATRPDLASEGPKKRSMVSATPACSSNGDSACPPGQTISGQAWSAPMPMQVVCRGTAAQVLSKVDAAGLAMPCRMHQGCLGGSCALLQGY